MSPVGFAALADGSTPSIYRRNRVEPAAPTEAPNKTNGVGGVAFDGTLPDLVELLNRRQVLSAYLVGPPQRMTRRQVGIWSLLGVLGTVWGVLATCAFTLDDFFVTPAAAVLGALLNLCLIATQAAASLGKVE